MGFLLWTNFQRCNRFHCQGVVVTPPYGMLTSFDDPEDWGLCKDAEPEEEELYDRSDVTESQSPRWATNGDTFVSVDTQRQSRPRSDHGSDRSHVSGPDLGGPVTKQYKLELTISDECRQLLGDLQARSKSSSSGEVFRRALALFATVLVEQSKGGEVYLHKNGQQTKMVWEETS